MLFPRHVIPAVASPEEPGSQIAGVERFWIETKDGKTEGWFVVGNDVSAEHPGPVVIFAHGNAELIDHQAVIIEGYRRLGVSVMMCEYRGYGRSSGSPSQKKILADTLQGYDRLLERPEVDPRRIVFHGRSVGTGVVCALAAERKPAVLILRSPFRSVVSMAARYLVPRLFVLDPFDNAAVIETLDVPILIMHGNRDRVIPMSHGRALHALAPDSTFSEYTCGHNDFPVASERHWTDVEAFLRSRGILP